MKLRECASCGVAKVATPEYYAVDPRKPGGIANECKSCVAARARAKRRGITCIKGWHDTAWTCTVCNETKEMTQENFFPVTSRLTNFDTMCRDCRNTYHRKHRQENRTEEQKSKDAGNAKNKHREMKVLSIKYLGGSCRSCGTTYDGTNAMIFDFHHRDPSQKEFQVLKQRKHSFEHNRKELDKCDLLCANCHRKEHSDSY